ncbi:hypothetical protein [Neisseria arctica]|nr:hypothetical protein [Neisseria arctica]UOO86253.1 hypothetical protein LVJ86_08510 [Neisseria arctica]
MKIKILPIIGLFFLSACATSITGQSASTLERNKANVLAFYDLTFNQHKPEQAVERYIGQEYL